MKLYHADEHLECYQYSKGDATLEIVPLTKNEELRVQSEYTVLCFVLAGAINLTSKKVLNMQVKKEEMALIPLRSPSLIQAKEDSIILKIKLKINISFCDHLPFDLFLEEYGDVKDNLDIGILPPNKRITDFAHAVNDFVADGLKCSFFFEIKIRELLYLIRVYYDKKVVSGFFSPIFCNDITFSNKIYENIDKVRTIKELAKIINYSPSGFEKRFKKVFTVSPYVWLQEQKSKKIYHEINCTKKTFSELAYEFGFSSPAHFSNFCKKYFGDSPGQLRKKNRERTALIFQDK